MIRALALCLALALVVAATVRLDRPPAPRRDAPPTEFGIERAMAHLELLAAAPRPPGSAAHAAARDYLLAQLRAAGLEAELQVTDWVDPRWTHLAAGHALRVAHVENVIGVLPGSPLAPAVLLVAHYDSKTGSPGASDDGYGVAALLEVARALAAGPRLERSVIVLFADAEEVGLMGAGAFVAEHPLAERVGVVLNFEARGNAGPVIMFETAGPSLPLVRALGDAAPYLVANSMAQAIYERMPNDTDFTRFREAGVPGMNFANIAGLARYHAPTDTVAAASPRTLAHHGTLALATARRLASVSADVSITRDGRRGVWFDLGGRLFIVYPAGWGAAVTLAGILAVVALAVSLWRRQRLAGPGVGVAMGLALVGLVGALGAGVLAMLAMRGLAPSLLSPSARPAPQALSAIGFVLLGAAVAAATAVPLPRLRAGERAVAGLGLYLLLTLLLHLNLSGGAWLLAWPALVAALVGLAALRLESRPPAALACLALGLLPGLLLLAQTGHQLAWAFGPLAGPPLALLAYLALAPLTPALRGQPAWAPPVALGAAALLLLLVAMALPAFDARHPRPGTLFLVHDQAAGKSAWVSPDPTPARWMQPRLGGQRVPLPQFFPLEPGRHFATGPVVDPPAALAACTPAADVERRDDRRVRLRLRPPEGALALFVHVEGGAPGEPRLGARSLSAGIHGDRLSFVYFGPAAETPLELEVSPGARLRLVAQLAGIGAAADDRPAGAMAKPSMVLPPHQELMDSDAILCAATVLL